MNICFICDTPYQMLNCINYRFHTLDKKNHADIYIGDHFHNCKIIVESLKKENLFDGVYVFEFPSYKSKIDYLYKKIKEIVAMRECLNIWTNNNNNLVAEYEAIFMSIYSHFSFGVQEINPGAKIYFYDDGIGTYLGKAQKSDFKKRRIIYRLLRKPFPNLKPDLIYVNSLDFYKALNGDTDSTVRELERISNRDVEFGRCLQRIFGTHNEEAYQSNRIIFLTQPDDNLRRNYNNIEKSILKQLEKYKQCTLLRVHPRQKEYDFADFSVDTSRNIWELVSLNNISNDKILIGVFSTAQFIPKILFDKEPTLIFTYRIHAEGYTSEEINQMNMVVNRLEKIYRDKDKILVSKDIEELSKILKYLIEFK